MENAIWVMCGFAAIGAVIVFLDWLDRRKNGQRPTT